MTADGLDNAPWYVLFFIRVGLPTAFASILLWFLLTNVTSNVTSIAQSLATLSHNDTIIVENQVKIIQLLNEHTQATGASGRFLEALCYNIAKDEAGRLRCSTAAVGK